MCVRARVCVHVRMRGWRLDRWADREMTAEVVLCLKVMFAERDKTWFLWQGKGKSDMLNVLGQIWTWCARTLPRTCLSVYACAFPHWSPKTFQPIDNWRGCIVLTNAAPCWPAARTGCWRETQLIQAMSMCCDKMVCLLNSSLPGGYNLGISFQSEVFLFWAFLIAA